MLKKELVTLPKMRSILVDGYENHESKIITPGVQSHGVRKGLQVEANAQRHN